MAQSVKLKDGSYIDASGVWDATQVKTQETLNSVFQNHVNKFGLNVTVSAMMFCYFEDNQVLEIRFDTRATNNKIYSLNIFTNTKKITLSQNDLSTSKTTTLWTFT